MATAQRPHLGAALTILAMFSFASLDAITKLLVADYPITQTLWVRAWVFMVFALAIARKRGVARTARSARPWLQGGRAVLGLVESAVFVLAFYYLPLADTHALASTSPLMVIAISQVFLGERAGLRRWLAVAAGFAGVLLIIRPGFLEVSWPLLLPLIGALMWAVYQVLTRLCAATDPPETTLLWTAGVGLVVTTAAGPWQWQPPDAMAWLLLIAMALAGSLGHYALVKALDFAKAAAVQPYSYTLLVFAAALGLLVFGQMPDAWTIAGAGIVVASGLYTWWLDRGTAA
ncbi:MAG: DMT family transporter [Alphaproteobacteria bacterium]|nr:DMT family transporter [Alphaproteobacteria bacterium]